MNITNLPGSKILQSYRRGFKEFLYPVMAIGLFPNISESEFVEILQKSRWIDRSTSHYVLVVIFSNGVKVDSVTEQNSPWLEELTSKMLDGKFETPDVKLAYNKTIDEATTLATELGIPFRELPCVLILDNSTPNNIYRIPYSNATLFEKDLASIVDFLHKKFPMYCEKLDKFHSIDEKITKFKLRGIPKRVLNMATNHPDVANAYSQLENEILRKASRNNIERLLWRSKHIRFQPNDISVFKATTDEFVENGIDPETISKLRMTLFEVAIKEARASASSNLYFSPYLADSFESLMLEHVKAKEQLAGVEHPKLHEWVRAQKIVNTVRQTSKVLPAVKDIFDVATKISSFF